MATMRKNICEATAIRSLSGLPALPRKAQRETAQHRDVEHLQYVAFAERADEGIGNDVEQKLRGGPPVGLFEIRRDARRIDVRQVDVHPRAGLKQIDGDKPDDQRDRGQHLEIDQRLERDAADFRHIGHAGNAVNHGAEDDRSDENADRLDEGVTERLHAHADVRIELAERNAERHGDQHQKPELRIKRMRPRARAQVCRCGFIHGGFRPDARQFAMPARLQHGPILARKGKDEAGLTQAALFHRLDDARRHRPACIKRHIPPIYPCRCNRA
jgi:hypothetical protein